MQRPTLKQLNYFCTLAEEHSFSRAAEVCNVTQSTLSAGIAELEAALEQNVIDRNQRNFTLTPFGEDILERAKVILNETDSLLSQAQEKKGPFGGNLRLGVIPTIAPYFLPLILPKLQEYYPDLTLQIHEDTSARILDLLDQGRLDILIMAFPYDTRNHHVDVLFEEPFYLAAPKSVPLPDTLKISEINQDDLLLLEDGHCLSAHALSACNLKVSSKRKTFSASSLPTLIQMVAHGYGVTLLPKMALENLPASIQISVFKEKILPTRTIGLCRRNNSLFREDYKELYKILKEITETTAY